jgi:hypothetical protein
MVTSCPGWRGQVWDVHVDDTVRDYIVRLVFATRRHKDLILGASPRGSHALYRGIQAYAAVQGRDFTLPDDVKKLAPAILSHRCLIHPESALRGHTHLGILKEIMQATPLDIGKLGISRGESGRLASVRVQLFTFHFLTFYSPLAHSPSLNNGKLLRPHPHPPAARLLFAGRFYFLRDLRQRGGVRLGALADAPRRQKFGQRPAVRAECVLG